MATADFGTDVRTFPRFDATMAPMTGVDVLLQDIAKLLTTPPGGLFWAPTATLDVRSWLNDSATPRDRAELAARIEDLVGEDPRIASLTATVTYADQVLTVALAGVAVTGQRFVMSIIADTNQITVTQEAL